MSKFTLGNRRAGKLTGEQVMQIRERYASGVYTFARLAREYHVSLNTVSNIINGVTWQDLPPVHPQQDIEDGALRSMRKLDELMNFDGLRPPEVLSEDALAAMQKVIDAQPKRAAEFEQPDDEMAKRLAAYGVAAPKPPDPPVGVVEAILQAASVRGDVELTIHRKPNLSPEMSAALDEVDKAREEFDNATVQSTAEGRGRSDGQSDHRGGAGGSTDVDGDTNSEVSGNDN